MPDKTLPSPTTFVAPQDLRVAIKPFVRGLWQRWWTGAAHSAACASIDLPVAHSTELYLKRGQWLVVQQGSCTIASPMQWQAERVVQSHQALHEGEAWQVPASGYYQLSQRTGSQVASSRVLIGKVR